MTLNGRELGAVLVGLRLLQENMMNNTVPKDLIAVLEDSGDALDVDEIDDLCERLNV
jgi:hypothetical protein